MVKNLLKKAIASIIMVEVETNDGKKVYLSFLLMYLCLLLKNVDLLLQRSRLLHSPQYGSVSKLPRITEPRERAS
jgi:hypothetical protein